MQTQYYAGWDGGGTKTLCRVLYQDGTAPQPFTAGALNPNGTVAGQCEATVADLLRNMAALPGGLDACRMLCIGAAGISNPATRVHLQNALQAGGYHGPVTFTGDQQTALYEKALAEAGEDIAEVFNIHAMMLDDDDFVDAIKEITR